MFEVGKTYATRSLCDYDCIFRFTVVGRSSKSILTTIRGELAVRRIKVRDGVESFAPFGAYSMSPIIYADERAMRLAEEGAC